MIEVQVVDLNDVLSMEVVIELDGTESLDDIISLIEECSGDTVEADGDFNLVPTDSDIYNFVHGSESLEDQGFLDKIALCSHLEDCSGSYWDLLELCKDLGLYHVDDFKEYYLGHHLSAMHFCEYYLEDDLSHIPHYIENSIDWVVLVENLSDSVYVYGDQYARVH